MQLKNFKNKSLRLLSYLAVFIFGIGIISYGVYADDPEYVDTIISVNNAAPEFRISPDGSPYEENTVTLTASTPATPINVGSSITFRATGDDQDGNQYYLAVCKTDSVTPVNNGPPTCGGGAWCVSSLTNDETPASCQYTALATDPEEAIWYAFVCDYSVDSKCSLSSQGTGDSGSPFVVNHRPDFTNLNIPTAPQDPGGTFVFNSTASDSDTYGTTTDDVYLLVCNTIGVTQTTTYTAPTCSGTQLNRSVASLTNPSTTYIADLDPGAGISYPDGTFTAYGYVYDQHNLLAIAPQTDTWTINNVAPTIAIDSLNTTTLTLTESTTTPLTANVTVTDNNSCIDITSGGSVVMDFFGAWTATHPDCNQSSQSDPDWCYPAIICTENSGINACAGPQDSTAAFTCTANVQYYAEATGIGSQHISDNWYVFVTATDDNSLFDVDSATNINVNLLVAFSVQDAINYGALDAGQSSATNPTLTVTSTGNTKIDTEVGATNQPIATPSNDVLADYAMCTDYPTCSGNYIETTNQEYSLTTFTHGTGIVLKDRRNIGSYPEFLSIGVPKTHWTTSLQVGTDDIYWSAHVPAGTPSGTYSGSNTLVAVQAPW